MDRGEARGVAKTGVEVELCQGGEEVLHNVVVERVVGVRFKTLEVKGGEEVVEFRGSKAVGICANLDEQVDQALGGVKDEPLGADSSSSASDGSLIMPALTASRTLRAVTLPNSLNLYDRRVKKRRLKSGWAIVSCFLAWMKQKYATLGELVQPIEVCRF